MLDRVAECACDWFLACNFVKGLGTPFASDYLRGHRERYRFVVRLRANWPDPGLSRNTRCCCYRCSVPGLAGFTKRALCGARDLITKSPSFDARSSARVH